MSKLILIKHAAPAVVSGVDSAKWDLSERGREQCGPLADRIAPHAPTRIISSDEPKAIQTAELLGAKLKIPHQVDDRLREHDRSNVPHLRSAEFISLIEVFFRRPHDLVLGRESANDVLNRFEYAVDDLLESNRDHNIAIVSHGTVLALYLAKILQRPEFGLWREMGLPSFVVLETSDQTLVEKVDAI